MTLLQVQLQATSRFQDVIFVDLGQQLLRLFTGEDVLELFGHDGAAVAELHVAIPLAVGALLQPLDDSGQVRPVRQIAVCQRGTVLSWV